MGIHAGYFAPSTEVRGVDVNPLTWGFGGSLTWTSSLGVWLGIQGSYFLGKTIEQTKEPLAGFVVDVSAQARLISLGGAVGFDLSLGPVVLRNALELGASIETWDFNNAPFFSLGYYQEMKGTAASFYLAPGLGVLVPLGRFYLGPELRYRIEFTGRLPNALGGQLQSGWRF